MDSMDYSKAACKTLWDFYNIEYPLCADKT